MPDPTQTFFQGGDNWNRTRTAIANVQALQQEQAARRQQQELQKLQIMTAESQTPEWWRDTESDPMARFNHFGAINQTRQAAGLPTIEAWSDPRESYIGEKVAQASVDAASKGISFHTSLQALASEVGPDYLNRWVLKNGLTMVPQAQPVEPTGAKPADAQMSVPTGELAAQGIEAQEPTIPFRNMREFADTMDGLLLGSTQKDEAALTTLMGRSPGAFMGYVALQQPQQRQRYIDMALAVTGATAQQPGESWTTFAARLTDALQTNSDKRVEAEYMAQTKAQQSAQERAWKDLDNVLAKTPENDPRRASALQAAGYIPGTQAFNDKMAEPSMKAAEREKLRQSNEKMQIERDRLRQTIEYQNFQKNLANRKFGETVRMNSNLISHRKNMEDLAEDRKTISEGNQALSKAKLAGDLAKAKTARAALDYALKQDKIPDPSGALDKNGQPLMIVPTDQDKAFYLAMIDNYDENIAAIEDATGAPAEKTTNADGTASPAATRLDALAVKYGLRQVVKKYRDEGYSDEDILAAVNAKGYK